MRTRLIIAGMLILVGLVWIGQGTGVIQGSGFMTDDMRWAAIGARRVRRRRGGRRLGGHPPPEGLSQAAHVVSARRR